MWNKYNTFQAKYSIFFLLSKFYIFWSRWYEDVMTWKGFAHYWSFVRGIRCSLVGSVEKRARNVMLWYFQCCKTEQAVQQSVELAVILDAMMVTWHHCDRYICSREIWVKVSLDDPWACSLMDQSFLPAHWTCHCGAFFGLRDCITGEK